MRAQIQTMSIEMLWKAVEDVIMYIVPLGIHTLFVELLEALCYKNRILRRQKGHFGDKHYSGLSFLYEALGKPLV